MSKKFGSEDPPQVNLPGRGSKTENPKNINKKTKNIYEELICAGCFLQYLGAQTLSFLNFGNMYHLTFSETIKLICYATNLQSFKLLKFGAIT